MDVALLAFTGSAKACKSAGIDRQRNGNCLKKLQLCSFLPETVPNRAITGRIPVYLQVLLFHAPVLLKKMYFYSFCGGHARENPKIVCSGPGRYW
ncbi:hypothetical protein ABD76_13450 [Paenibacillus dendritiformis]|nr:hypothetical protein [Paenibacillus dendritiformis]